MSAAATPSNGEYISRHAVTEDSLTTRLAASMDEADELKKENSQLRERAAAAEAQKQALERANKAKAIFIEDLAKATPRERKEMLKNALEHLRRITDSLSSTNDEEAPPPSSGKRPTPDDDDDDDDDDDAPQTPPRKQARAGQNHAALRAKYKILRSLRHLMHYPSLVDLHAGHAVAGARQAAAGAKRPRAGSISTAEACDTGHGQTVLLRPGVRLGAPAVQRALK